MRYETVIGLEVHVELATESKIFCSCSAKFGGEQNEHVCPACCGMPGMLPIVNKHVVDLGMTAGMMLNCKINRTTTFDKKSYYYPDLPCSYQTTQWFAPICVDGYVAIDTPDGEKKIGIKQIHMEEDAGKLVHDDWTDTSLVDFNRTSVPLIEIVSRPDLSSADEVVAYLEELRSLLRFAKVSQCRWEQGSMRCDVNLSVRPEGSDVLGVRTEMKNMNSLSAIVRAIEYETSRHIDALENGTEELVQETRRWDDVKGKSFAMRNKETAGDYRYFPDPNIMPVVIDDEWYGSIKESLPEFPKVKKAKYVSLGLSDYDAEQLVSSRAFSDVFDAAYEKCKMAKEVANRLITDCMTILNKKQQTMDALNINGTSLGELILLISDGKITLANAKRVLAAMFEEDIDPAKYAEENGLIVSNDTGKVEQVIKEVIAADPKAVADYKGGKEKAIMALFGKAMKQLGGNCNPQLLKDMLIAEINKN
ncbi:MAG: Asp-tRNA(Asn)/Glu-tRNA(Gln) amidotransferase subunit GatB [Clostridia bacterium]|nr:Asp-tRNA(Asn)/Glu-tRNA(Gln) amidotransferase subunit GatB [Clostridia bacterium]